jgi:hypothetical protein
MSTNPTLKAIVKELAALAEPGMREVNECRRDDHGRQPRGLRTIARRLKTQHELSLQLDH